MSKFNFKIKGRLNRYQRNNLEILTDETVRRLRSGDWSATPAPILKCINCGGRISTYNLRYFDYRGEEVLCYHCQTGEEIHAVPAREGARII